MSEVGKIALSLKQLRERAGLSTQDVADALTALKGTKVSKSTYTHYESKKFKQPFLPVGMAKDLVAVFQPKGVPERDVLALAGIEVYTNAPAASQSQPASPKTTVAGQDKTALTFEGALNLGPKDLPILGYVKAGSDALFIGNGEVHATTTRPDSLIGVAGAYAVRVHDVSMSPALQPGWTIHVDPHRPCRPGDIVVIQMKDDAAFVKILVRRTEKHIICRQLNPSEEIRYETALHRSVHRVVGAKFLED